ncbi:MAG TPA: MogA/MoaB family molybdenum cofactor biosynthesis protein [Herpetosiphonaceae bacterium]
MPYQDHQQAASEREAPIRCAILTISDTRTAETDTSGALARQLLEAAGHRVAAQQIVADEPQEVVALIRSWQAAGLCDVVLTNGGTGISRRDATIEAIEPLLDKQLPGFGELFRMLSFQEIGSGAMLSRAIGGVAGRTLIFCMPGSTGAVRLAMERLILPELAHLAWELVRQ